MSNVHTLNDIKDRGHWLGSAYEQELKKKLRTAIDFNSEITDFNKSCRLKIQSIQSEKGSLSKPMLILKIRLAS